MIYSNFYVTRSPDLVNKNDFNFVNITLIHDNKHHFDTIWVGIIVMLLKFIEKMIEN